MLHILFIILKILLILVAVVLGLVLLLLMLVLFCPVRYQASVSKEPDQRVKEIKADCRGSWLFGMIAVKASLGIAMKEIKVYLFGLDVAKLLNLLKKRKKQKPEKIIEEISEKIPEEIPEKIPEETVVEEAIKEEAIKEESIAEESIAEEAIIEEDLTKETPVIEKKKKFDLIEKLKGIINSIKEKIKKIKKTIQNISSNIEWFKKFLSTPRVQEALKLIWNDIMKLIKHILPKKIKGKVRFGSDDPSVTGNVLAAFSVTLPLHQNKVELIPVFEGGNILEGKIALKGRIYGIILVKLFVELYFNKNVKYLIWKWKKRK